MKRPASLSGSVGLSADSEVWNTPKTKPAQAFFFEGALQSLHEVKYIPKVCQDIVFLNDADKHSFTNCMRSLAGEMGMI